MSPTKHIGIAAVSAEGAALCYRTVCAEGAAILGRHDHPQVTMHTYSLADYMRHIEANRWDEAAQLLLASAEILVRAGADFLISPDNTTHQALDLIRDESPAPWLHIAEEVASVAATRRFQRLGLLGTRYLMEGPVYPPKLAARGIAYEIPESDDRERINSIIFNELVCGRFEEKSRRYFQGVIEALGARGCDAVILGCTEIPLLIAEADSPLPAIDSTRTLARAALREATRTPARKSTILAALLLLVALGGCATAPSSSDAEQIIPAATQQMMDALPSDATVWQRYVSDSAVYVSEAGDLATKQDLLEAFAPFPQGISGSIQVKTVKLTDYRDVAIHVFDAHETQTVYDQRIEVNYRSTHTWRREKGQWRLIAAQNLVLPRDPSALPVSARLSDYAGTYDLSGKRRYRVEQRGEVLLGGRENGDLTPLIPVGENVFADAGSNLGILRIFLHGADGVVDRMVQRRKLADLTWMKVAE
jgi:aspartate racemase